MKPRDWSAEALSGHALERGDSLTPRDAWISAGALIGTLILVHWSTLAGLANTWRTSDTYAHGALAIPIAAWLLWRKRQQLADVRLAPSPLGILLLLALTLIWLVGDLSSIKSLREFAFVASLPAALIATLGTAFARRAVFPLIFCLFAWPFGEIFVPTMANATADFTVVALRLTGVPVYRDGNSFVIPSGNWSVVEECSGIRYLIVSIFAGTLFSYLSFRSSARRWGFVALSIIVPVFANWLRAYGIVLLGHLSGNRIAAGVDHLVYGWLFFGIVMTLLFYAGARWMGEPPLTRGNASEDAPRKEPVASTAGSARGVPWASLALGAIVCVLGPALSLAVTNREIAPLDRAALALPNTLGEWTKEPVPVDERSWMPYFENPDWQDHASYSHADGRRLRLHVAVYERQREGSKLVNFQSGALADVGKTWLTLSSVTKVVSLRGDAPPISVTERITNQVSRKVLAWDWSWIEGNEVSTLLQAKVQLIRQRLLLRQEAAVRVVIDTDLADDPAGARALLSSVAPDARALPAKLAAVARRSP